MTSRALPLIEVVLPFPPSALSPNAHVNRWRKAEAAKDYRHTCRIDALNVRRDMERQGLSFPLAAPVSMRVTFVVADKQRRDWTNLIAMFKSGEDGIVDSGLISDDSIQAIGRVEHVWAFGPRPAVRVRLEGA